MCNVPEGCMPDRIRIGPQNTQNMPQSKCDPIPPALLIMDQNGTPGKGARLTGGQSPAVAG